MFPSEPTEPKRDAPETETLGTEYGPLLNCVIATVADEPTTDTDE